MADWARTLEADFDLTPATVDSNAKLTWDSAVKLALWQDLFGAALDAHWTEDGFYLATFTDNGTVNEAGGVCTISCTGGGANGDYRDKGIKSPAVFNDLTVSVDIANFAVADFVVNTDGYLGIKLAKDDNNYVQLLREKSSANGDRFLWTEFVGGVAKEIATFATAATTFKLRLIRSGDNWTAWYDVGVGWTQLGGTEAAAIGADCILFLGGLIDKGTVSADFNNLTITGSGYYWDDSPECYIINSAAGAVEYVVDMGLGGTFAGTGFADTAAEPGTSTVKYKMGYGDAADRASATFDTTWRTEAELDAKVANGDFDGHRYVFLKAQFNSDGTDQPTLTDVTISGADLYKWSQSATQVKEGANSFRMVSPSITVSDDYYSESKSVIQGEDYYVEAFVYCTSYTDGYAYLQAYDVTGAAEIDIAKLEATTSGWRKLAFYFTVPAGCTEVSIRIGGHNMTGLAVVYWDCADSKRLRMQEYS